jgi:hypothetical protein|tara:strand:+ start:2380 stop:2619 length:240 start_codon:yes stop_codon:yes gene_type:complete
LARQSNLRRHPSNNAGVDIGRKHGVVVMKTIKFTKAQLEMLRVAWDAYDKEFWKQMDQKEDKRKIKMYGTVQEKLWGYK